MVRDAWLPIGHLLPDGAKVRRVLHDGRDWQIISIQGEGRALVVRAALAHRWIDAGLLEAGRLGAFDFGRERFLALSFPEGEMIAPVVGCRAPCSKGEALAFATALRATRAIDPRTALQDALYLEPLSRLLPTYALVPVPADDALVLGSWLTGGAPIRATSLGALCQVLNWMRTGDVEDVVRAAGLEGEGAVGHARRQGQGDGAPVPREPFALPGRSALEAFLREQVIHIVENAARYRALGIGFPSAFVLHGPPGCGKTFAVEQLVAYLDWPSFQIDAASVASPYIHDTSRKVAEVFEAACEEAPSVLVIDEMEAFLFERSREAGPHRVEEAAEFLRRIPEAAANGVLVVAMTNRLDMIDPAFLRRGRFDHVVEVGPPGEGDVTALLEALLARLPTAPDVDAVVLAGRLSGRALSDVAFVVREGARFAARAGRDRISQFDLLAALKAVSARDPDRDRRIGWV